MKGPPFTFDSLAPKMMSEGQKKRRIRGQYDGRGIVNGGYGSKYICFGLINNFELDKLPIKNYLKVMFS